MNEALPLELAHRHRGLGVGTEVDLVVGRSWPTAWLADVVVGAGFEPVRPLPAEPLPEGTTLAIRRCRTLADTVAPGMAMLVCGLNPSLHAADLGVGFARGGNRFWPAARAAGLVTLDRDPLDALTSHGIGMTDLVKRATTAARELRPDEYRVGLGRVERLVRWLRPEVVCFVGLAGWRVAVDRTATAGRQAVTLDGTPVYLMPSTSGLNTHSSPGDLADHLRAAARLARR